MATNNNLILHEDHTDIYLFSEMNEAGEEYGVCPRMADEFIKNLHEAELKEKDITLHMKTCGGDWKEGMAIYDAIKSSPEYITAINYSHARSMSSLIFLACDYRMMHKHSTFMFHRGEEYFGGTARQMQTNARESQRDNDIMVDIYARHLLKANKNSSQKHYTGNDLEWWSEWVVYEMNTKEEVYFNAQEALDIGFADEII